MQVLQISSKLLIKRTAQQPWYTIANGIEETLEHDFQGKQAGTPPCWGPGPLENRIAYITTYHWERLPFLLLCCNMQTLYSIMMIFLYLPVIACFCYWVNASFISPFSLHHYINISLFFHIEFMLCLRWWCFLGEEGTLKKKKSSNKDFSNRRVTSILNIYSQHCNRRYYCFLHIYLKSHRLWKLIKCLNK